MSREYRKSLGFTNQEILKKYFKCTDVVLVNWEKIGYCNERLKEIFQKINDVIASDFKYSDEEFDVFKKTLDSAYELLKKHGIIENKFNNNGRAPEGVYYNWMRGYAVGVYFSKIIAKAFGKAESDLVQLGRDNLKDVEDSGDASKFQKEALADFEIKGTNIHIEVQAGFTGDNDIKWSKAHDAKTRLSEGTKTYVLHFDLFNGRLAVIDISQLEDTLPEEKWVKNTNFEGVYTASIPSTAFKWDITKEFPDESIVCTIT